MCAAVSALESPLKFSVTRAVCSSGLNSKVAVPEAVELAVTIREREGNGALGGRAAAADFGNVELDAAGNVDADPVILAGGRALDRAALGPEYAGADPPYSRRR